MNLAVQVIPCLKCFMMQSQGCLNLDRRPTVQAYCQSTLGYAFRTLSEPEKADRCLKQAYLTYKKHTDFSSPELDWRCDD